MSPERETAGHCLASSTLRSVQDQDFCGICPSPAVLPPASVCRDAARAVAGKFVCRASVWDEPNIRAEEVGGGGVCTTVLRRGWFHVPVDSTAVVP